MVRYRSVNAAQKLGLIASCHDLSDGGLGVALAETAFAGGLGIEADLGKIDAPDGLNDMKRLFSESASRLLVTVNQDNQDAFETVFAGQSCCCIGQVVADEVLKISGVEGSIITTSSLAELKTAWQATLKEM
jgi:phosphoribosylformylglycinamidine synthase